MSTSHGAKPTVGTHRAAALRVVYVDGPGDVEATWNYWKAGRADPDEINIAFSAQFFDAWATRPVDALVISTCARRASVKSDRMELVQKPKPFIRRGGIWYHLGQIWFAIWLMWRAVLWRADVLMVAEATWMIAPLSWFGVKIVPIVHCALWPRGCPPTRGRWRVQRRIWGWFYARAVSASIVVSPEITRQIETLAEGQNGPVFETMVQYDRGYFARFSPAQWGRQPFRLMFAGRIEISKGVMDIVEAARQLNEKRPGRFAWDICGGGSALDEMRSAVARFGLEDCVRLHGPLQRDAMRERFEAAAAVVVPTTRWFAEGLNRVFVESILAGRPPVITTVCGMDRLTTCALEVPPNDPTALAAAVERLAADRALFQRLIANGPTATAACFDRRHGWAAGITGCWTKLFGHPA